MHSRVEASATEFLKLHRLTPEEIESKNIFITCQSDEDLPYLTKILGNGVLVAGTDYGHNDAGSEIGALTAILQRSDIDADVSRAIVDGNGRKLYGLANEVKATAEPEVKSGFRMYGRPPLGWAIRSCSPELCPKYPALPIAGIWWRVSGRFQAPVPKLKSRLYQ